jgi:hypothetical protein
MNTYPHLPAASKGHLDVLHFLSAKGADLEVEDPKGRTPLHYTGGWVLLCRELVCMHG